MKPIKLPIMLYTEAGMQLKELGIESETEFETINAYFRTIDMYYWDEKNEQMVIYCGGLSWVVDLTLAEFEKRLKEWQK